MTSFQKAVHDHQAYRTALIEHYRDLVRDVLLNRIAMPLTDPHIQALARELADELHITPAEAATLLKPTAHGIYAAAQGVAAND